MTDKFETAKEIIRGEIVKRQAELDDLFAAFERLGGTYEDETAEAEPAQEVKRLTGPKTKAAKRRKKEKPARASKAAGDVEVSLNGKKLLVTERHAQIIDKLIVKGTVIGIDDLVGLYGGVKSRWYQDVEALRAKLAEAGMELINIKGLGYKLEKAA